MQLKTKHRLTKIGLVPEDWDVTNLGDIATFRTGPFGSALHKSDYTANGIPLVNPMHIIDGCIVPSHNMTVTAEAAKHLADFVLRPGDVIIGRRGEMGRCAVVQEAQAGWLCGTGSLIIRGGGAITSPFLQLTLSSPTTVKRIEDASVGSTMINLNQQVLKNLKVPLPPLPEQRAIATALSDVDALINSLDRLIAKKRDIKQATMQQLLTGKTRLPGFQKKDGFKNTEIGFVPTDWEPRRLGSIIERLDAGVSVNSIDEGLKTNGQNLSVLKTSAVADGNFYPQESKMIVQGDITKAKTNPFKGTIIISRMNTPELVGECGYVWKDFPELFLPDRLWMSKIRKDSQINAKWLTYMLSSALYKKKIKESATGTSGSMKNISKQSLLSLIISTPSTREQDSITVVLSDMDDELSALERRREKVQLLKQGMMQELLTGRTRLV